jgi:thiol-disulfide isomerase/thioredoxin
VPGLAFRWKRSRGRYIHEHVRRYGRARYVAAGAMTVFMVAGCAARQSVSGGASSGSASTVGVTVFTTLDRAKLPAVSGQLVGGGKLSLAADRGHVLVLNFWGSWCSVCRQEAPALSVAARQFRASGVRFVGVDVADESTSATAYMHHFKISYPSLYDPDDQIAVLFSGLIPVGDFPSTLIVTPNGKIAGRVIGAITDQDLQRLIKAAE